MFDAFLQSWPFAPWVLFALILSAMIYLRGWRILHQRDPQRWQGSKAVAFLGGLAALFLALASPIEPFASLFLQIHMVQHLLLMMMAPPLLWLGAPLFPLLRGLPQPVRIYWIAPLLRWRWLRRILNGLTQLIPAWLLFVGTTWLWHLPAVYELALRSNGWHYVQHACFLITALLFWYPVLRPYPARFRWSPWLLVPYLILADVQNTALSALFTFSEQSLYPYYAQLPSIGGITPLDDQAMAGVIMWVPGSLAFLLPLFWISVQLLYGKGRAQPTPTRSVSEGQRRLSLPLVSIASVPPPRFDLLHVPVLGRFLRWRHARLAMQIPLLLLAVVIIVDGLRGPQVGAMNLAGVLPWIHWRGLIVLGLLIAGNVFCMGCPFLLPRTLARRWLPAHRSWPRWLRSKWLAVALLLLFLWAYEAFALWDRPAWTAMIALAYFGGALIVDGFFRGAAFCKYVCPIGQFNFVQSLVSPLEVKVRDPIVCTQCETKDCIRGRENIPGCELHLYLPRKASNLDCTFCLDCIHACPHDNVGMLGVTPGAEMDKDRLRSGVGRLSQRWDLAVLVLVLVFGAFANAAGMVGPVLEGQEQLAASLGLQSSFLTTTLFYLFALILLPFLLIGSAIILSQWWGRWEASRWRGAARFTYALVPLGFGMWLTHYSFHFLTSYDAAVPAVQRFTLDLGGTWMGSPQWTASCCLQLAGWLLRLEILFLDLGLLLSLYTGYRIARSLAPSRALRAFTPWALVLVLLFAIGIWIVFQPMQMRGTLLQ